MPLYARGQAASRQARRIRRLIPALCVALGAGAGWAATLEVRVENIQQAEGQVRVVVYDESNWLSREEWIGRVLQPAQVDTVEATFELPPGSYAVAVVHDVNGNGRMDTRFRFPREPYGFSRGAEPKMGPPKFEDAVFEVADEGLAIAITLSD